ncbi:MAG: CvpA family protein [Prevotellaceae bacterium]|jgi:membrane protein required for colicin V production|nr:CvpA family protein [Prevotellaceae bacterium]
MIFDIIFLLLFFYAIYLGVTKGLILQLTELISLISGIYLAYKLSFLLAGWPSGLGLSTHTVSVVAFIITFILVVVVARLVGSALNKIVKVVLLGWANRLCGVLVSVLKMAFIISIALLLLNTINDVTKFLPGKQISDSKLYSPLAKFAPSIFPYLAFSKVKATLQDIDKQVDKAVEKVKSNK